MTKKETAVTTKADTEQLEILKQSYPVEQGFNRIQLPRIGMMEQDKTEEGKGKAMKVVAEAGDLLYRSTDGRRNGRKGKKIWDKKEIGTSFEGTIVYKRKQLRFYDSANETYTSSPYRQ